MSYLWSDVAGVWSTARRLLPVVTLAIAYHTGFV
jgi:hypothetical protein